MPPPRPYPPAPAAPPPPPPSGGGPVGRGRRPAPRGGPGPPGSPAAGRPRRAAATAPPPPRAGAGRPCQPAGPPAARGRDPALVAIEEAGEQRGEQRLVDRRVALEPLRGGERRLAQHRPVQAGEALDREPRRGQVAALDLVALLRRPGIAEQQAE